MRGVDNIFAKITAGTYSQVVDLPPEVQEYGRGWVLCETIVKDPCSLFTSCEGWGEGGRREGSTTCNVWSRAE